MEQVGVGSVKFPSVLVTATGNVDVVYDEVEVDVGFQDPEYRGTPHAHVA